MRKIMFVLFMLLVSLFLYSKTNALIFFVNIFDQPVDVRLGEEDDFVFKMDNLESYTSSAMLKTQEYGSYALYFKTSDSDDYYYWADENKKNKKIMCDIKDGYAYCIVCGNDGKINYFMLKRDNENLSQITFFNGTDSELTRMEVSKNWGKNVVAFTENIGQNIITNFVSISIDNYSLFWQFPEQVSKDKYFFYADKSGKNPEIFRVKKGEYYIFIAFTEGRKDYVRFFNITP